MGEEEQAVVEVVGVVEVVEVEVGVEEMHHRRCRRYHKHQCHRLKCKQ